MKQVVPEHTKRIVNIKEKEYEPARQIVGLGWTGMRCARESARKRVQESLKSIGLVIVDVDDDDKKGRSEIVAVASSGLTKAIASGTGITEAIIRDAYAEVGHLMAAGATGGLDGHGSAGIPIGVNGMARVSGHSNVPFHKDEC